MVKQDWDQLREGVSYEECVLYDDIIICQVQTLEQIMGEKFTSDVFDYHHHHHKHQGLDSLICSISRVTVAHANASSVFQLFSFLVNGMVLWHSLQV